VPLELNNCQRILNNIVKKQNSDLGYVRVLLDKVRRFGGSTYIEARAYWRSSLSFNFNTFICAHEEDSTDTLFAMARLFHERNPIKPITKYSSKKELVFDSSTGSGLKSEYSLACAKTTSAGRSQGIHFLHGSEVAFWPDNADELLDGLMSCISTPQGTEVYLESTGNGYGNRFQRDVFDAYCEGKYVYYQEDGIPYAWKNPNDDWVLVFIPWFAHNIYTRPFDNPVQKKKFIDEISKKVFNKDLLIWEESEDIKLQKRFKLSLEQLNWRRWTIANTFKGRVEKFRVEYPATIEDSFLSTGSNVFPADFCDMLELSCKPPVIIGDVVERLGKTKIRRNPHGSFSLWDYPEDNEKYFFTVDSAGGKKERHKIKKQEPDPTCIDVYCHRTGKQVAQWHGHIEYDMIADIAELIGNLYHRAIGCVELQNHGYTVVAGLKQKKYPMYEWKDDEPGWSTNVRTKPLMVDGLYEATRDGAIHIQCKETIAEMRTFIEENGTYNAEAGCHDERVDTAGMASQMMYLLPKRYLEKKRGEETAIGGWLKEQNKNKYDGRYQEVYVR
jgi:hypothetical protein